MILLAVAITLLVLFGGVVLFGAPYIPSLKADTARAFDELYELSPSDTLVDLGSGDGAILLHAARHQAAAVGVELNPILVIISRLRFRRYPKISVKLGNMWQHKLSEDTTVVYCFPVGRDMQRLMKKIQEESNRLGKPLAFISYGFRFKNKKPAKIVGAHALYKFLPLQPAEAQV